MTSIIVECRQLNNDSIVIKNGDFITTLNENILLEENDQILIRNGFIDSIPISNEYINLSEDYTINANFLYYDYNYSNAGKPQYDNFAYSGLQLTLAGLPNIAFDGQSVAGSVIGNIANLTTKHSITGTDFALYTDIEFFRINDDKNGNWGDIPFEFHYYNIVGDEEIFHGIIPSLPNGDFKTKVSIGKIIANTPPANPPFLVITPLNLVKSRIIPAYNNPAYFISSVLPVGVKVYEPIIGTKSGVIPKGKYAPQEIAARISKIFQEATPSGPFDINATNSLLIPTNLSTHKFMMNINSDIYKNQIKAVNEPSWNITNVFEGKNYNQYVPAYNYNKPGNQLQYWVGSSQFDVQYDDDSNKFFIEYMHMPYYGAAEKNIQTPEIITINKNDFIKASAGSAGLNQNAFQQEFFYTKANSGIALTSLFSSPSGFWDDICGFDLNNLTVQAVYDTLNPAIIPNPREFLVVNELSFLPYIDYTEGKNITAPFLINDMSVQKDATFAEEAVRLVGEQLEVAGINSIYADNVILNNINENAYYLIEIQSKFQNNLLTSDFGNMKSVAGIANTYFNSSNFTSTNSADSFIYQHNGESQMLQSFGIRILDSKKNLASGLGPDNTVFIQIIKAPKIPPIIESKEEKQIKGALREQHEAKERG